MSFEEFRKSMLKVSEKRNHKIKGSVGIKRILKYCNDNNWFGNKVSAREKEFSRIVSCVNALMAQELLNGNEIILPCKMGALEIRKFGTYVKFVDGKVKTNRGINWKETLQLWYEDEEAKKNKTLLKMEDKEVFTLHYNRIGANYNNKIFYKFKPHRILSTAIRRAGNEGKIEAYTL